MELYTFAYEEGGPCLLSLADPQYQCGTLMPVGSNAAATLCDCLEACEQWDSIQYSVSQSLVLSQKPSAYSAITSSYSSAKQYFNLS